ncbi:MAG: glycosyltransferase family 2 protein [Candidatus Omnitrophica bacterium]|nr:glycosyltransferase family 2 protein [Candidatus Omnitrophota bacterium]
MKVEIFILNYNGRELLSECLPSIRDASCRSKYKPRVIVVDNQSNDGSYEFVSDNFADIDFKKMKQNRVLCSFNDVLAESDADIAFLLNNDITVKQEFIDPIIDIFEKDPKTFMVAPKFYKRDEKELECIWFVPHFRAGVFNAFSAHKIGFSDDNNVCYTFQCGIAAFDRKKFLQLSGYDDIYLPGRLEDSDICFRAWKKGYKCYYQPKSIGFHKEMASFKKRFSMKEILTLSHRNTYIFMWKNITDPAILAKHFLLLIPRFGYALLTFKIEIIAGFFQALGKIRLILQKRKTARKNFLLKDREVFALFTGERKW